MLDDFLQFDQEREIKKILRFGLRGKSKFFLWQNLGFARIKKRVIIKGVDWNKDEITFVAQKGSLNFRVSRPVYLYFDKRKMIFKCPVRYCDPYAIVIPLPKILLLENEREHQRVRCELTEKIRFLFTVGSDGAHNYVWNKAQLIDISDGGLSFKVGINRLHSFERGDELKIQDQESKEKMHRFKVVHIGRAFDELTGEIFHKVGGKFI